ncbi:MAG: amino acid transporter rane protein family [Herbinix sp.]|jgi:putative lysine transport system permease protein|nr:amino acid transporter rane protein family [Herbinix sp.]
MIWDQILDWFNPMIEFLVQAAKIVEKYWPMLLRGAGMTLFVSILGTIFGTVIGFIIGTIRTIPLAERGFKRGILKIINAILSAYVEFFRGTPMIVQASVIYYGSLMALGIDMDRTFAAVFIVSINTGAYMTEIIRGGIISIDKGQFEAAHAIGMNHTKTMFHVILPQVMRNILPALGNEFVINIKDTSVLNVIAVTELFFQTKSIAGNTFKYFETYFVTCLMYLAMTLIVTRILRHVERKMDGPDSFNIIPGNQMQVAKPEDLLKKK